MLVVDLHHWLLPSGELAPQARLAPYIAMIVECATICVGDGMTAMVCRHRDARRRCSGRVCIATESGTIEWSCNACHDAGTIRGWQRSRWDLSDIEIGPDDEEHALYVPLDELRTLRDLDLPPTIRATLAGAMLAGARFACVPLTEAELTTLIAAIDDAEATATVRRRLDRTLGRAEQLLLAEQLARRLRAH